MIAIALALGVICLTNIIREFVFRFTNEEISDQTDFLTGGYVNSLFLMQLVMFLELEFQIKIEDDDLITDNLKSIECISELVESYL